jgi:hypothetical protein
MNPVDEPHSLAPMGQRPLTRIQRHTDRDSRVIASARNIPFASEHAVGAFRVAK